MQKICWCRRKGITGRVGASELGTPWPLVSQRLGLGLFPRELLEFKCGHS